jgi:nucleoside-diphosphate-sugar epimerase
MRILVIGGSGFLGREVVEAGLQRGYEITTLARAPDVGPSRPMLRSVQGDARNPAAIREAVRGHDAVIHAIGPSSSNAPKGRANARRREGTTLFSQSGGAVIEAMQAEGVDRLIAVSNVGVGDSAPALPWILRRVALPWFAPFVRAVMADKERMEEAIRQSRLDWTIVRFNGLGKGAPKGSIRTSLTGKVGLFISVSDAARFLIDQVEDARFVRAAPSVSN